MSTARIINLADARGVHPQPAGIAVPPPCRRPLTGSDFQEAHRLADDAELLPEMSASAEDFFRRVRAALRETSGSIETELLAMTYEQLVELNDAAVAIIDQGDVAIEDDFLSDLISFELHRRDLFGGNAS